MINGYYQLLIEEKVIYLFDVMAEFDVNGSDKHQMSILEQNGYGQIKTSVKNKYCISAYTWQIEVFSLLRLIIAGVIYVAAAAFYGI